MNKPRTPVFVMLLCVILLSMQGCAHPPKAHTVPRGKLAQLEGQLRSELFNLDLASSHVASQRELLMKLAEKSGEARTSLARGDQVLEQISDSARYARHLEELIDLTRARVRAISEEYEVYDGAINRIR